MNSILFLFLLIGAPFFWVAIYSFFNKKGPEDVPIKEGLYLSVYSMAFVYLLFITQS
jgi:uncharacterized membrane protein